MQTMEYLFLLMKLRRFLLPVLLLGLSTDAWAAGGDKPPIERVADVIGLLGVISLWICCKAGRLGLVTWLSLSASRQIQASKEVYSRLPVKSFLVGVVSTLILFVVLMMVGRVSEAGNKILTLVGLAVFAAFSGLAIYSVLIGVGGLFQHMGSRLTSIEMLSVDQNLDTDWRDIVKGGFVFETATLVPLIGNLIDLYFMVTALGASVLSFLIRKNKPNE
jgi:hypothetical protein